MRAFIYLSKRIRNINTANRTVDLYTKYLFFLSLICLYCEEVYPHKEHMKRRLVYLFCPPNQPKEMNFAFFFIFSPLLPKAMVTENRKQFYIITFRNISSGIKYLTRLQKLFSHF